MVLKGLNLLPFWFTPMNLLIYLTLAQLLFSYTRRVYRVHKLTAEAVLCLQPKIV